MKNSFSPSPRLVSCVDANNIFVLPPPSGGRAGSTTEAVVDCESAHGINRRALPGLLTEPGDGLSVFDASDEDIVSIVFATYRAKFSNKSKIETKLGNPKSGRPPTLYPPGELCDYKHISTTRARQSTQLSWQDLEGRPHVRDHCGAPQWASPPITQSRDGTPPSPVGRGTPRLIS
jgi:hypothetical protein